MLGPAACNCECLVTDSTVKTPRETSPPLIRVFDWTCANSKTTVTLLSADGDGHRAIEFPLRKASKP